MIGIIFGTFGALVSLLVGHSAFQALLNYVMIGNLGMFMMLAFSWMRHPDNEETSR